MSAGQLLVACFLACWLSVGDGAQSDFFCRFLMRGECQANCRSDQTSLRFPLLCPDGKACCRNRAPIILTSTTTTSTTTTTVRPLGECGFRRPIVRIIMGDTAERCEFPWMVFIQRPGSPCGAALIDNRHVLTAAHCVTRLQGGNLTVVIGEYNRSEIRPLAEFNATDYTVYYPNSFNRATYENDLAILKLRTAIPFHQYECLSPICLPTANFRFQNTTCTVAGWGQVTDDIVGEAALPNILQKVDLPIVDDLNCLNLYTRYYYKSTNYCVGDLSGTKDSCGGDSGGPLMCPLGGVYYVAGIVSAGLGCAVKGRAAIYTDVAQYIPWINSIRTLP